MSPDFPAKPPFLTKEEQLTPAVMNPDIFGSREPWTH